MSRCPNCQYNAPAGDRFCPRCGMDLLWDPNLRRSGRIPDWALALLGCLAAFAAALVAPIGLPILLIVLIAKRGTPFAKGIGIGCAVLAVVALGAFAVCLAALSQWK